VKKKKKKIKDISKGPKPFQALRPWQIYQAVYRLRLVRYRLFRFFYLIFYYIIKRLLHYYNHLSQVYIKTRREGDRLEARRR
jgi:hypothetical protein